MNARRMLPRKKKYKEFVVYPNWKKKPEGTHCSHCRTEYPIKQMRACNKIDSKGVRKWFCCKECWIKYHKKVK